MRAFLVLCLIGVLSALTLLLLAGHGPWAGRVIWQFEPTHGLNAGDVPVLALWAIGVVCCLSLLGRRS